MKLFVSPHNDDAVLFGAFRLLSQKPVVLTVYDSYLQPARGHAACSAEERRREDIGAIHTVLGCDLVFAGLRDTETIEGAVLMALSGRTDVDEVWLPAVEKDGHPQHNLVGEIGGMVFRDAKIHRYLTYTAKGKSTAGNEVKPAGRMVRKKLLALACYKTQLEIDALGCWPHFMDLREFEA